MFMIYWSLTNGRDEKIPQSKEFDTFEMGLAMTFMEALRKSQHEGHGVSHITMSSENPDRVGKDGVDEVGPDYDWMKRRTQ